MSDTLNVNSSVLSSGQLFTTSNANKIQINGPEW